MQRMPNANAFKPKKPLLTFSGGFGGSGSSSAIKGKGKGSNKGKRKKKNASSKSQVKIPSLFTPEGRMEHIKTRITNADFSPLSKLALMKQNDGQLALDIDPNGIAVIDNFLGNELITSMRSEAESLLPSMVPSQSTKWDEATQSIIPYEKRGVLSMQVEGGAEGYDKSPRLVE